MQRDWKTFPNYAYSIAAQKDVLYVIKSLLTNTNSVSNTLDSARIWTVTASSNASTTSASDLWTSTAALTRAAAGTAHSWIVMYNSSMGVYLTLDYVGAANYTCDAILSTDQPSGGTTLNRPTTSNGVSFAWNFDRPTLTAENRYFSMTADEYAGFHILHHRGNGEQVVVAMLAAVIGHNGYYPSTTSPPEWMLPQRGYAESPTLDRTWVFMQAGGNQTGNAHLMTPSGTNTAANLFAASGGKVRLLTANYNTQAAPNYASAALPPRSVSTSGTEASFFGTVNSTTYGTAPVNPWPILVTKYNSTAPATFDFVVHLPDHYVTPYSTAWTSPTASTGGIYYATEANSSSDIKYIYCNGLVMPWGSSTVIQGSTNWGEVLLNRMLPNSSKANFGGSKDNKISARNGRGVGGW